MSKTTETASAGQNSGIGTISETALQLLCKAFWLRKASAHNANRIVSEWIKRLPNDAEGLELLSAPPDWEDALTQAGFRYCDGIEAWADTAYFKARDTFGEEEVAVDDFTHSGEEDPEDAFHDLGLDVADYERDVFGHWIIDEWFSDRLEMQGAHCPEWHGLRVWCRTTTGQATYMDDCVRRSMLGLITDDATGKVCLDKLAIWSETLGVEVTL